MDDALVMRGFQRLADLFGDAECFIDRNRTADESSIETFAIDEFEHQELCAVRFLHPMDLRDVWMIQRCENFGFTLEPSEAFRIAGYRSRQHLDGDLASEVGISGAIHLAHAAAAQQRQNLVDAEAGARSERHGTTSGGRLYGVASIRRPAKCRLI